MVDRRRDGRSRAVRLARLVLALPFAFAAGILLAVFVDPGYPTQPNALPLAVVPVVAAWLLARRSRRSLLAAVGGVVAGGVFFVATTSGDTKRGPIAARQHALLVQIRPYAGAHASAEQETDRTSSDWGISRVNPPDEYDRSRTDRLPPGADPRAVGRHYEAAVRALGFRDAHLWHMHPPDRWEAGGRLGSSWIAVDIESEKAVVSIGTSAQ